MRDLRYIGYERFRSLMLRAGYRSTDALGKVVGVSGTRIRQIRAGIIPGAEEMRQKIAAVLKVAPERIWKPRKVAA